MRERVYRQIVVRLASSGHASKRAKRDIREDIVHRVLAAEANGEPWAAEVLARWQIEGAERDYERAHGQLNTTTYITKDGRRRRKTTSYSRPVRSAESGEIRYEQRSFWDYERPAFNAKRAELAAQGNRIAEVVAAMDLVNAAWARHPKSKTARAAWLADGHSLDEIDLTQAA